MTTIATDGKTMAGDGQRELCRTIVYSRAAKVRRLSDGRIFGTAGDTAIGLAIEAWLEGRAEKPTDKPDDGFNGLILTPDGKLTIIDAHCVEMPAEAPVAVGSGMDFAIGAMAAGASPLEAVQIACRYDPGSGGEITTISLK